MINVNGSVLRGVCDNLAGQRLTTLAEWAKAAGMGVGIVSTTRLTHATPAGAYGHSTDRNYENDALMPAGVKAQGCQDLALQLMNWNVNGASWDVALGGGRRNFQPESIGGARLDGRNLLGEFISKHGDDHYVNDTFSLAAARSQRNLPLLGLFAPEHMAYHVDCVDDPTCLQPRLAEMTATAIELLSHFFGDKGYFLLVEGGRIDMGHHEGDAYRALTETVELHKAVGKAVELVSTADTLLLTTADHVRSAMLCGRGFIILFSL